ncbi:MAG: hypothetical protein M3016_05240 [Actinomycetota bacterium]|nr:hypothetical protein [Actinomycetota bacterium]
MTSERTLRLAFLSLGVVHLAIGVWMFAFPHSFFTTVGAFGSYNRHYERDTATFYFAFSLGALMAAVRPAWRVPVLAMTTLQYTVHTINHAIDVDRANNSWAGIFDLVSLGLATVQFAALLWLLGRAPSRTAAA